MLASPHLASPPLPLHPAPNAHTPPPLAPPPQVLAGVRLVFTRVIPLEQEPSSHPLWRLAESCGATCSGALDAGTTHVIAGASGTEKVRCGWGVQSRALV